MLLSDKTMAEFGYSQDSLSQYSKKLLWLACDYCGAEYTNLHCNRNKSNAMLDKDACKACKAIKSFKWTDGKNLFNRMKFPSNTGYDRGLYKLWDCGQLKFSKSFD